jgi:2'-5' RNA ligase
MGRMKYYTTFLFAGHPDPNDIHCTHRYLGELDDFELKAVLKLLTDYFAKSDEFAQLRDIEFATPDFFGSDRDIRFLRPHTRLEARVVEALLPDLRAQLDPFAGGFDYGEYKPHVTTERNKITSRIDSYALVGSGGVVIAKWNFFEANK